VNNSAAAKPYQRDMFGIEHVVEAYRGRPDQPLTNAQLYKAISEIAGVSPAVFEERQPIGKSGQRHSLAGRKARWHQQSLRRMGVLEGVKGKRGVWRLTEEAKRELHPAKSGVKLLGYSTDLGVAIWGESQDIFRRLDVPVSLIFSSPPYALRKARNYGNPDEREIVAFICEILAPVIEALAHDGSLVLNVSQDIFMQNSPARSTYLERLVLTICDRFGLHLTERLVWSNPSKAPGPIQWASKTRQQLNVGYEPILVFCRNPLAWKADNRRVLQPHTERHQKLMAAGGEKREASYSDGAYKIREGSFGRVTEGRIPKNVLTLGQRCRYGIQYNKACKELGIPSHGAGMPFTVPEFMIQWLTEPGDMVIDPFGGRGMSGLAAELLGRRWMIGENQLEYIRGGAELFRGRPGFQLNPAIEMGFLMRQLAGVTL
jgi:DNA modification methylase